MKQRPRIYYTESQRALMWERWQKGDTLHQIAQLFDRHHPSIARIFLGETGGIRPAPRCRSRWALTLAEREEISRAVVAGHSMRLAPYLRSGCQSGQPGAQACADALITEGCVTLEARRG